MYQTVSKESECRERAAECVELAQSVKTSEERTMLLHIAETWLRLADQAGRNDHVGAN